jgi:hypothetical protein
MRWRRARGAAYPGLGAPVSRPNGQAMARALSRSIARFNAFRAALNRL